PDRVRVRSGDMSLEKPATDAATIAALRRSAERHQAAIRALEQLVEDRTRQLYLALEEVRRQARAVRQQAAAAIMADSHSLAEAAPRILRAVCESMAWDVAAFWVVDAAARAL